jgi:hypothetical protein
MTTTTTSTPSNRINRSTIHNINSKRDRAATTPITGMTMLPSSFVPGPKDVICGRGRKISTHPGNRRYQVILDSASQRYSSAMSKHARSVIVSEIVDAVRCSSNGGYGGFVKQNKKDGRWYEVGNHLARERVSQNLRDSTPQKYKSSSEAKRHRREALSAGLADDIESMIHKNKVVNEKLQYMVRYITDCGENCPELFILNACTSANTDILNALKKCSHHTYLNTNKYNSKNKNCSNSSRA